MNIINMRIVTSMSKSFGWLVDVSDMSYSRNCHCARIDIEGGCYFFLTSSTRLIGTSIKCRGNNCFNRNNSSQIDHFH